ncbi:hypothetical protein DL89DRAFT_286181 [Linderina pennispora]|uniref:F-box domain-containing protein n=1 Tax=Linderina pennispora TaxID=61395 RepID=A0A1Y1VZJ5_9FUNG|nr:uncharacterized protein DL89DRAFT_286181 [Linderina pennispora]ORX66445.1 hypothetical protein DL89DRAFT_286181 [Linderina pennispora]
MPRLDQLPDEILARILQVLFDETSDPTVDPNEYPIGDSNEKAFLETAMLSRRLYELGESALCRRAFVKVANDIDDVVEARYGLITRKQRTHLVQRVVLKLSDHPSPVTVTSALHSAGLLQRRWPSVRSLVIDYRGVFRDTPKQYPEIHSMQLAGLLLKSLPNAIALRYQGHAREHYLKRMLGKFVRGSRRCLQSVHLETTELSMFSLNMFRPGLTFLRISAYRGLAASELPKVCARTLEHLAIAGLQPADFWSRFYFDGHALEFANLQTLELNFISPRPTVPLGRPLLAHAVFPRLRDLAISNYKFSINGLLAIFPRAQIRHLKVMEKSTGGQVDILPFVGLQTLVLNDWHNKELERMLELPTFVHPFLDAPPGLRALTLFTLRTCSVQTLRSRGLQRLTYLHLLCYDRISTVDELATIDDFIADGRYAPVHPGITRLDITGYQPEIEDCEGFVEQLVCLMAGLPSLECMSLNGLQDHYTHAIRETITMHLHDTHIAPYIAHLHNVYIQEITE